MTTEKQEIPSPPNSENNPTAHPTQVCELNHDIETLKALRTFFRTTAVTFIALAFIIINNVSFGQILWAGLQAAIIAIPIIIMQAFSTKQEEPIADAACILWAAINIVLKPEFIATLN